MAPKKRKSINSEGVSCEVLTVKKTKKEILLEKQALENGAVTKKKRIRSFDELDKIARAAKGRLPPMTLEERQGVVNSQNQTVDEVIGVALKSRRASKGRLNTHFWIDFFKMFPSLKGSSKLKELELDPGYELQNVELRTALRHARNKNPAFRSTVEFENFWANADEASLQRSDIIGAVKASQEGDVVTKTASNKMCAAISIYVGRSCVYNINSTLKSTYININQYKSI